LALALVLGEGMASAAAKAPLDPTKQPPPDPPAAGRIQRDSDGHIPGSVPPRVIGPGPFQNLPSLDESRWVVVAVRDKPYWKAGTLDPVLSNACSQGDFITGPANSMVVRFTAEEGPAMLQVVVPTHRHLLFDRRKLAKPNESYLFKDNGWPSCQVWINGKATPRKLDSVRGTSVPKPDPMALKKRKAQIRSWPQN
jgi:hypothetical protein